MYKNNLHLMKTPFYDQHYSLGSKIVDFHGWQMPLQYSSIIDEHKTVRSNVGLFDVSHMGRFKIKGNNAKGCLQNLLTNDVSSLKDNHAIYSPICFENGGIVDDVIVSRFDEEFLMVVNSSNIQKDWNWINEHSMSATIEDVSENFALLALQGPFAQNMLTEISGSNLEKLKPFDVTNLRLFDVDCIVSRTGYTGEDGFEIFFDSSQTKLWDKLLKAGSKFQIKPIGLGARDTLRLEAGLMLYGNDIDENITPFEAPLKWTVKLDTDFIGKKALENQKVNRKLVGFEILNAKRPARKDNLVYHKDSQVGKVTSGSYSPTLNKSIGFSFVPIQVSRDEVIQIKIGDKMYDAKTTSMRFYKRR